MGFFCLTQSSERGFMFTLEIIQRGHVQFTGPDFPKLVAYFKDLGMVKNTVNVQTGQVTYESADGKVLTNPGYQAISPVAKETDREQFVRILRSHQAGQTDFPTFCEETAQAGVSQWVMDLDQMTCSYLDLSDQLVFVETVPTI